jgi:hypothetical protein
VSDQKSEDAATSDGAGQPADKINVRLFRQTLYWPLALVAPPAQLDKDGGFVSAVAGQAQLLESLAHAGSEWSRIDDPLQHIPLTTPQDRRHAYAEFVYFHEFIQNFLYVSRLSPSNAEGAFDEPFRLCRRMNIEHFDVSFTGGFEERSARFHVDRCLLYLFRTGVAILAVELSIEPSPGAIGTTLPDMPGRCVNVSLRCGAMARAGGRDEREQKTGAFDSRRRNAAVA